MTTIDPPPPSAERLDSRLEFETLISDTSAALVAAPPEQLDLVVERALNAVRRFFHADRCALLSVSADQQVVLAGLASYGDGVPGVPPDMNLVPAFPWSFETLIVKRTTVRITRLADLPPDAATERESWVQTPITSALTLPIESGGLVRHLMLLNTVQQEREWPDAFLPRLRVLGEILSSALAQQELVARLREAEDGLRDLSRRLIRAHEEERALLARELHDDVTQRLAVLSIDVGRALLAAPHGAHTESMESVRGGLMRLSEDIHSLAYQLHPAVLQELGLVEAFRAERERWGRQGRLDVTMDLDPILGVLGKEEALCLFRVAQEALNNVARHSGARTATVTLRSQSSGLVLAIADRGAGFDQANPDTGRHIGLASMRDRVRLVNGTLDIESAPGRGATILVWVPAQGESS